MEEELSAKLPDYFAEVLEDISKEPAFGVDGALKKELVQCISSSDSTLFLAELSQPLFKIVLTKKKIMPSAQYEESLSKLNELLADKIFCDSLKNKLLLCIPSDKRNVSHVVVKRLVWRLVSSLLYKMQQSIFRGMKLKHRAALTKFVMSESDRDAFKIHVGRVLRTVYRFGMNKTNNVWILRCKCLRERFVDAPDKLTNDQFINESLWKENSVFLSRSCLNVFMGLERISQDLLSSSSPCTANIIFKKLSDPENVFILEELRILTQGILNEDLATSLLQELIRILTSLSGRLEARRSLDMHTKTQKTSTVSLRTNLKRDPKTSVSVPSASSSKSNPGTSQQPSATSRTASAKQATSSSKTKGSKRNSDAALKTSASKSSKPSIPVPEKSAGQSSKPKNAKKQSGTPAQSSCEPSKPSTAKKTSRASSTSKTSARLTSAASPDNTPAVPTRASTRIRKPKSR